ncbi:hypothetical protein C8R44DRAFT_83469 [Mycena epipterygia]|nr:hypothetical protein C8R44DRAFT_83469 [Mycena epipterygia]
MSHLTASPFHKPSPFEFPQRNVEAAYTPPAQLPTPASIAGGPDLHSAEYFESPAASVIPDASARFRRVTSSIVYHNSGLRESRERTVQRSSRSFVVVLPPPSLPQDHGHLGHTLSSGPRHRLSQGLLMPLFPTMYGQLTAIAREYNFPSTTGLCLYLHFTDNGITVTPRISDDSWQMIWNHAFDPAPSSSAAPSLPISGKIEFDIDLRLARWYGAWMASSHREHVDVPMSVTPSAAPSIIHYREESRTTFADGDDQDSPSVARPPARHVPRKLSLIDRFDAMSARSVPRSVVARTQVPEPLPESQNLSPIFQEDEPKTAKYDLEHRVKSWRASSSVLPGAIAEAGHILLAGANLPNSPLDESPMPTTSNDERNEDEYRIEDYSFSISSAGPGDYDPYSPLTWYYDPSVDLAHRAQGSVCMTPSDCTSFGPSDYTLPSYVPSLDLDGVRTPDIAHRMFEDVPPSPSVATSWGAPLSYPPSPTSEYRAPSVDLGDRQHFSRPTTPMTATSWGAPESYPPSPTTPFYVHTPDAGQRAFDLSALSEHDVPWSLVWPYHDTSRPWTQVWPYNAQQAVAQERDQSSSNEPWNMVWPYHANPAEASGQIAVARDMGRGSSGGPWNMVWPYHANPAEASGQIPVARNMDRGSSSGPWNMVWPYHADRVGASDQVTRSFVYPYFDLYPAVSGETRGPVSIRLAAAYPVFDLYPATYPGNLDEIYPPKTIEDAPLVISTRLSLRYPSFDLYPAVYPHVVPYPQFQNEMEALSTIISPSYYPHFNLYPPIATSAKMPRSSTSSRGGVSVVLQTAYPVFNLYPAIYPAFDIYPALEGGADSVDQNSVSIRLTAAYPTFNLYPAVYPDFELYPALPEDCWEPRVLSAGYPDFDIYGALSRPRQAPRVTSVGLNESGAISVRLPAAYPIFDLYPPVYPVLEIYPSLPEETDASYGYPHFNLYPPVKGRVVEMILAEMVSHSVNYPNFNLYPAVYPYFDLYPEVHTSGYIHGVYVGPVIRYPVFNLYPAVYPFFDLYPGAEGLEEREVDIRAEARYPYFNLYPAIYPHFVLWPTMSSLPEDTDASYGYPHFNLYPPVKGRVVEMMLAEMVSHPVNYPNFNLYPAVYPYFDLYPEVHTSGYTHGVYVGPVIRYPVFNLYPAVYPFFDLYPGAEELEEREVDIRAEARYPYFNLYPAIYPHFDLWPTISAMEEPRLPKQSRFTRSDLHALVKKAPLRSQRNVRAPSKTHRALHSAVFPQGVDVLTPSGTVPSNTRVPPITRAPSKTHLDLHRSVFQSDVNVSTPSGTDPLKDASAATSASPRLPTRLRSGSVLRMSLPPSPRPVGGRSPTVRAPPPTSAIPEVPIPTEPSRRTLSTATKPPMNPIPATPVRRTLSTAARDGVADRVAHGGASLTRSVSMASPPSAAPQQSQLDRAASVNGPRAIPQRRDSMVLQRVRAMQRQTEPPIKEQDDPISSFPLPPRSSHPPRKVVS